MPLLHIDTQVDLFYPYVSPSGRDYVYVTYLSFIHINGDFFPVSIAMAVEDAEPVLLPSGTVAHVTGSFSVSGNSLLVTASEIIPVYVASSPQTRAGIAKLYEPFITAVGSVSSERVHDLRNPAALVVDVTVERQDRWPHTPTTLRCHFNRDERRFRTLIPMVQGTPLILSGLLTGWEDGKLALDIHEVCCNNNGAPPESPLAVFPNPFQQCPMIDGYAIFDGSTPPPEYSSKETVAGADCDGKNPVLTVADHSKVENARGNPVAPRSTVLSKRSTADRAISPGRRPSKVPRTSARRENAV